MPENCPFIIGEIAVFDSSHRQEIYIAQVEERHIKHWGTKLIPAITKATVEQKQQWFDSGEVEVIIKKYGNRPGFMSVTLGPDLLDE